MPNEAFIGPAKKNVRLPVNIDVEHVGKGKGIGVTH